ncbi:uncharacterized protein LOC143276820 [Babylonia areolata]|uniref:uncharacterized protein LOC143276820 n=1 Tax=Babylonia areolata TaxID=304850 RepID=UPI003FD0326B
MPQCSPMLQAIAGTVQLVLCLIFCIVGFAIPQWGSATVSGIDVHYGLWEYCANDNCVSLPDALDSAKVSVAKYVGMVGMVVAAGTIVVAIIFLVTKKVKLLTVSAEEGCLAILLIGAEFGAGLSFVNEAGGDFGASFGLTLIAVLLALSGTITLIVAKCRHGSG